MDNDGIPIEKSSKLYGGNITKVGFRSLRTSPSMRSMHRLEGNGNAALIQIAIIRDPISKTALKPSAARFLKDAARTLPVAHLPYLLIHLVALATGDCAFSCDTYICFNIAIATTTPTNATRNFSFIHNT